jgi:peptide/nickel transport system substrate-binding protein
MTNAHVSRRNFFKIAAAGAAVAAVEMSGLGLKPGKNVLASPRSQTATLRVAWGNAPATLDPASASSDVEIAFLNAVYDYLIDTNASGELVPRLATSWSVSDDGLAYTLQIAEGVKFHDGSDLTLDDIIWTFERLKASNISAFETVAASEGNSIVFTLATTNPDFLYDLSDNHALILKTDAQNIGTDFNGTGPFRLQEYITEDRAIFTTNADYWGGVPTVGGLEFIYFADTEAAINALRGGLVDVVLRMDNATFVSLSGEGTFNAVSIPTGGFDALRLRADRAPGNDPLVREAFRLATDRQAIFDRVQLGFGAVGRDAPISPIYGAVYSESTTLPARDPAAARELLTQAGYPDGLDMTLYVPNSGDRVALAQTFASQWEEAGIRVTVEPQEESVYYADNGWLEVDLGITGWGSRARPGFYLRTMLHSEAIPVAGEEIGLRWNESHFADAELDEQIDIATTSPDAATSVAAYHEIQRILIERGPLIVPYFFAQFGVLATSVGGVEVHPFAGRTNFHAATL